MEIDTGTTLAEKPAEYVFEMRRANSWIVPAQYIGGFCLFGLAVVGFIVSILHRTDQMTMQGMTTVPILLGIGLIAAGASQARSPREVGVGPDGVRVVTSRGSNTYSWDQVGWAKPQSNSFTHRRELVIYDRRGKKLVTFVDSVVHFDYLVQLVNYYIGIQSNPVSDRIRSMAGRRTGAFLILASLFLLAIAGANIYFAHQDQQNETLLKTQGVVGTAQIERRFIAPNGVTARLEYRIASPSGLVGKHNAQMDQADWDLLGDKSTVKVIYVPSSPDITRLASGEVPDNQMDPMAMYGLSALLGVMCLIFIAAGILNFAGWDIGQSKTTGKFGIRRFGDPS